MDVIAHTVTFHRSETGRGRCTQLSRTTAWLGQRTQLQAALSHAKCVAPRPCHMWPGPGLPLGPLRCKSYPLLRYHCNDLQPVRVELDPEARGRLLVHDEAITVKPHLSLVWQRHHGTLRNHLPVSLTIPSEDLIAPPYSRTSAIYCSFFDPRGR
jgi:hypothetical protein